MGYRRLGLVLAVSLAIAGCSGGGGGGDGDGDGDGATPLPPQESVRLESGDLLPFQLQAGRYRFGWDAPACDGVDFTLSGQSSGFSYEKQSAFKKFSAIMGDVPDDTFEIAQAADCPEWVVTLDRIGS
jgi:hypothetical protein